MNKLEEIKKFWLAPIFKEFEYNELRDHNNDIEWLISRVEESEQEVAIAQNSRERAIDHMKVFQKNYNQERRKNRRYREALKFYANKDNYKVNVTDQWEPVVAVDGDNGQKARQALEGQSCT